MFSAPLTQSQQRVYNWLVTYIRKNDRAPTSREIRDGLNFKSTSPVTVQLKALRNKGYIDWDEGKARTIRIQQLGYFEDEELPRYGIPILGEIFAGPLLEPATNNQERLDLSHLFQDPQYFALRVTGDSMVGDYILEGDIAILFKEEDISKIQNGTIVAATAEERSTTLKRFYQQGSNVRLEASNPKYKAIVLPAEQVTIQGMLFGIWRGIKR